MSTGIKVFKGIRKFSAQQLCIVWAPVFQVQYEFQLLTWRTCKENLYQQDEGV